MFRVACVFFLSVVFSYFGSLIDLSDRGVLFAQVWSGPQACAYPASSIIDEYLLRAEDLHWKSPERKKSNVLYDCAPVVVTRVYITQPAAGISRSSYGSLPSCPAGFNPLCDPQFGSANRENVELKRQNGLLQEAWFNVWSRCESLSYDLSYAKTEESFIRIDFDMEADYCEKKVRMHWSPEGRGIINSRGFASAQIANNWDAKVVVEDNSQDSPRETNFKYRMFENSAWQGIIQGTGYGWGAHLGVTVLGSGGSVGFDWSDINTTEVPISGGYKEFTGQTVGEVFAGPVPDLQLVGRSAITTYVRHSVGFGYRCSAQPAEGRGSYAQGSILEFNPGLSILVEGEQDCSDRAVNSWDKHRYSLRNYQEHFCHPIWAGAFYCGCPAP